MKKNTSRAPPKGKNIAIAWHKAKVLFSATSRRSSRWAAFWV
jgi:hypothetical protein